MNALGNIQSLSVANPARYATQQEVYDFFVKHFKPAPAEKELYRRVLLEGPIHGRHFALEQDEHACLMQPHELLDRFRRFGTELAGKSAASALEKAHLKPADVGGLVVSTCTGYLCPGFTSYISEALGLPSDVRTMDLVGMGCGAAIPNLQAASGLSHTLAASGAKRSAVLSVCVEICSATLFLGSDEDLIISNSIFGDGAAAAVVNVANNGAPVHLRLVDFETQLDVRHREDLRYRMEQGRLRNVLSRRVPVLAARAVKELVDRLLARHGLSIEQIDFWAVHPGGSSILDKVQEDLGLTNGALEHSWHVLKHYGNMSSPSVMFVLREILQKAKPKKGQRGLLLSFGAGFSAHGALVEA